MSEEEKQIHLYMHSKNELGLATLCVEKDKEIERLNNIIKKVLFILEHMKDDRVGYEVCIDLLKGDDKE